MANSKKDIELVTQHAYHAAVVGNGAAAVEAAQRIDKDFILVRKTDLPFLEQEFSHPRQQNITKARTAAYRPGTASAIYRQRALDFLAIAQHAEQEEGRQAERELDGKREQANRMLFPKTGLTWNYADLAPHAQAQIDVVVGLMSQVDELKDKK